MAKTRVSNKGAWGLLVFFVAVFLFSPAVTQAYDFQNILKVDVTGEAFGKNVSSREFFYYYKTASMFTRTGETGKRNDEDVRQEAWQNLIFVKEANSIGIHISKEELKEELKRLLKEKDVEYGSDSYAAWVMKSFGEDVATFEKRIEDLMVINLLLKEKLNPSVTVTEEEMKEKFLNQYNSFESEYILFTNEKEASDFAVQCKKNPRLWYDAYQAKKPLGQKGASWINIMSLEALIDLWKIPKEDAIRILNGAEGDFIAAKNYYGDVVFRLLYRRKADLKDYNQEKQEYYRNMLTQVKKHKIAQDYLNDLFKRANFRDFLKEKEDAEKKIMLKNKSRVVLETTAGVIELQLFPDVAPLACENFIGLIEKKYYNGIIFHRVVKDFMIQGGDPTGSGTGGESIWGKPFADEVSDKTIFDKGFLLASANSGPDTNQSQFFITVQPTPWLNGRHTIFGEVVAGSEVVKKINVVETDTNNKPKQEQKIISAIIKANSNLLPPRV
jgi:peptidylprolyl isomerase